MSALRTRQACSLLVVAAAALVPWPAAAQDGARSARDPALGAALDAALVGPGVEVTALVVETASGAVLYAHEPDRPLTPASNMKLLTTAAALARLGQDFAHETRLLASGPIEAGVLRGDLWLVGGGDPTFSRRFDPDPLLAEVADAVRAAGITRVEGGLVLDERAFDPVRLHPEWTPGDAERWYGAEVSPLTLNDNCIDVSVAGGATGPQVELLPDTGYVRVEVRAEPTDEQKRHVFSILRVGDDKRTLRVQGRVWRKAGPYEASVPVTDPGAFMGAVLLERLAAAGVAISGPARRPEPAEEAHDRRSGGEAPRTLWTRRAPLPRTLEVTNQRSQNLYAECLLKTLGRLQGDGTLGRGGSWERGAAAVLSYALECGVRPGQVRVSDGSGLSRANACSARALVTVLRAAIVAPTGGIFVSSLASPGAPGTLRRRLRGLPDEARVRAKTGSLSGVDALSGYLEVGDQQVTFAFVHNGKRSSRSALDRALEALARHLSP